MGISIPYLIMPPSYAGRSSKGEKGVGKDGGKSMFSHPCITWITSRFADGHALFDTFPYPL